MAQGLGSGVQGLGFRAAMKTPVLETTRAVRKELTLR